jgi:hypothetical protein
MKATVCALMLLCCAMYELNIYSGSSNKQKMKNNWILLASRNFHLIKFILYQTNSNSATTYSSNGVKKKNTHTPTSNIETLAIKWPSTQYCS